MLAWDHACDAWWCCAGVDPDRRAAGGAGGDRVVAVVAAPGGPPGPGLLLAAEGLANEEIGRRVGVSSNTVRAWRQALPERGVEQVGVIAKGRGRRSWLAEGAVEEIVRLTFTQRPDDTSTHWTTRSLGKKVGVSNDTVARIWRKLGVKPWKVDTFKVSGDPDFEAKLRDVVGLYLDPPAKAAVFSFDEKTQGNWLAGVGAR